MHGGEVDKLREHLEKAGNGNAFILQGGDCAERFRDCTKSSIENKIRIILQMSLALIWITHRPVVRILRGAGQFAKPRSSPVETVLMKETVVDKNGSDSVVEVSKIIPSFRGDNINGFDQNNRTHDPQRLLQAYFHSSTTINYIRALIAGGFASLLYPHKWDLEFVKNHNQRAEYSNILDQLQNGLKFLNSVGTLGNASELSGIELFTSHEGLVLDYETAVTDEYKEGFYNLGAHLLWIGDRTRSIDGAHIEYFRGIQNPVGLKCGPTLEPEELERLVKILNPDNIMGKLVLITRYGKDNVEKLLPAHIAAVKRAGANVVWISDPMHGNTFSAPSGLKTRNFESIMTEIETCFKVHKDNESVLGGIHLEMTGENVTECVGGAAELDHCELSTAYETYCDPRLNYIQSLDVAFRVAELLKGN